MPAEQVAPKPPKAMSFAIMRNAHEAIRGGICDCLAAVESDDFPQLWGDLKRCIHVHAAMEDEGLFKLFNEKFDDLAKTEGLQDLHDKDNKLMEAVDNAVEKKEGLKDAFETWSEFHESHLTKEEKVMMPKTKLTADTPTGRATIVHNQLIGTALRIVGDEEWEWFLGYCMRMLEKHSEGKPRARVFAHGLQHASTPAQWAKWLPIIKANLSEELFNSIEKECSISSTGKIVDEKKAGDEVNNYVGRRLKLAIEYCSQCGFSWYVDELKKAITKAGFDPYVKINANYGRKDSFEVSVDGEDIFSKLETKEDDPDEISEAVIKALKPKVEDLKNEGGSDTSDVTALDLSPQGLIRALEVKDNDTDRKHGGQAGANDVVLTVHSSSHPTHPSADEFALYQASVLDLDEVKEANNEDNDEDDSDSTCIPYYLRWPFFSFPHQVDERQARAIGMQVCTLSILSAVFKDDKYGAWIAVFIFIDFLCRFIWGGKGSLLGATASMVTGYDEKEKPFMSESFPLFNPVKLTPGPPKQFAAFCGLFFAGLSSLLYFHGDDDNWAGMAVILGLAGASGLEGFVGICAGCIMFEGLEYIGVVSTKTKQIAESYRQPRQKTVELMNTKIVEGEPASMVVHNPNEPSLSNRVVYKVKRDEWRREDFNPIKHCTNAWGMMPLGLWGLTHVVNLASTENVTWNHWNWDRGFYHASLYVSFVFSGIIGLLYVIRLFKYPKKCIKEWNHPVSRHFFIAIPLSFAAGAGLFDDNSQTAANMWWFAASTLLAMNVLFVVYWIRDPVNEYLVSPLWMFGPVACVFTAHLGQLSHNATEFCHLLFGFGTVTFFLLLPIVFRRLVLVEQLPHAMRSSVLFLVAAPAVIALAWFGISGTNSFDTFSKAMYLCALAFYLVVIALGAHNYFNRGPFNIGYWGYAFPSQIFAFVSMYYSVLRFSTWTYNIANISIVIALGVTFIVFALTLANIIRRKLFIPTPKFGPLSLTKLFHYAMREACARLCQLSLSLADPDEEEDAREFIQLMRDLHLFHTEHAKQEEHGLFPYIRQVFTGITGKADADHDRDHAVFAEYAQRVDELEAALDSKDTNAQRVLAASFTQHLPSFANHLSEHFDEEELHLSYAIRKFLPIDLQKKAARAMFETSSMKVWAKLLPFTIKYNYVHRRKVAFLTALRWSMPEKIQHIGVLVKQGLNDDNLFARLAADVPEITPRDNPGWIPIV